jgi:hypothetical protein
MKVHNALPLFLDCMNQWTKRPSQEEFHDRYLKPIEHIILPMLEDFGTRLSYNLYDVIEGLDWKTFRKEALTLDPIHEEKRLARHIKDVESLLGVTLKGETLLFGAFTLMDGYARFHRGTHCVYLGVDESHGRGRYLDILTTHELTHVARESQASVWKGFGLDPKMTHDEFVESLPVVEHLMNEGYSCVISEILCPDEDPWHYAYQSRDQLKQIAKHGPAIDKVVHAEIRKKNGAYGSLYDQSRYVPTLPRYAHYVWAWQWAKHVLNEHCSGDARKLLGLCSKELVEDALKFQLKI